MPAQFTTLSALLAHGRDTLIDVRSPAEYTEDHIPGAINLPALSNAQRAEVGTIYKQISPFDGRKTGAAMVARNVADHISGPLADKKGDWQPLVYCWRGGQRSGAVTSILSQIGWRADTIQGGYQSFRQLVYSALYESPLPHRLILLDGNTGTAKTAILHHLAQNDVQTLDLEGLANHRGSLLGAQEGGQPAQKAFETQLACQLARLSPDRPVLVEAESSKIGQINLPPRLWQAMCAAPRIMLTAPQDARAAYLATAYKDLAAMPDTLIARMQPLRRIRGHAAVDAWEDMLRRNELQALAAAMIATHYDPAYAKSRSAHAVKVIGTVATGTLDADGFARAADRIAALIRAAT